MRRQLFVFPGSVSVRETSLRCRAGAGDVGSRGVFELSVYGRSNERLGGDGDRNSCTSVKPRARGGGGKE